jgi:hypothetical protein
MCDLAGCHKQNLHFPKKNMHLLFQSIGEAAAWDARSWDTPD